ncbi:transcription initiation factor TFIID component TAF4 family [Ceratobasidium sp. AG-Ba]|nr:transcription initiation factor TFIID component TAF4 family [Ceratobasidium sp. AG-Ba]
MSSSVETTTTKKQKLNNGAPLSTMSAPNPTPSPAPAAAPTNGVQQQSQAWAQIPIDPALQNTQATPVTYPSYTWPPQPTGAPAAGSPASGSTPTPQPIRAKTSTPAPSASPKPPTTTPAPAGAAPTPAPGTAAPYAPPYYAAAPPGYRYPYPPQYQGQPPYAYYQAPGGQYYAVATPPQPVPAPQTPAGAQTPAQQQQQQTQATSTLNDALAGIVDLRAEEDALAKSHQDTGNTYFHREGDRSKRPGPALEQSKIWMSERLKAILSAQGLTNLPEEALNYAMIAWKVRLQMLFDKALAAAEHRHTSQYSRAPSFWNPPGEGTNSSVAPTPMWSTVVKRDVAKQLSAIERAEKEEETRARRERRTAAAQADAEDGAEDDMDVDGRKAKKLRSVGPGVAARVMPQEMNIKSSNNTANRAAGLGGGKYAWMTAGATGGGAAATPAPKPKPAPTPTPAPATPAATTTTASTTPALKSGGWGRAYAAVNKTAVGNDAKDDGITVTLRDALFVASRERGFGAGRGSGLASAARWE